MTRLVLSVRTSGITSRASQFDVVSSNHLSTCRIWLCFSRLPFHLQGVFVILLNALSSHVNQQAGPSLPFL